MYIHIPIDTCLYSYTYRDGCPYRCSYTLTSDCYSLFTTHVVLQSLEPFYDQFDPDFINIRKTVREVLQKEDDLNEIVQLVGKVSRSNLYACHLHHQHSPPTCCVEFHSVKMHSANNAYSQHASDAAPTVQGSSAPAVSLNKTAGD